ncbi:MAG: HAD-IIIA family hydrolase [bacterium]
MRFDNSWTLFLDRDGVINRRIIGGYVRHWDQFEFLPGVLNALGVLSGIFGKIIVVSNQQGVGKQLMRESELDLIHEKLIIKAEQEGGRIDAVYFSPHLEREGSVMRKPKVGMALKARWEHPGIQFKKSVMAGDSLSDMLFGKRLGMITVLISTSKSDLRKGHKLIDYTFHDLATFATTLVDLQSTVLGPQSANTTAPSSPPSP